MPITTHLVEGNYPQNFPPDVDTFPTVTNEEHYFDAWLLNKVYNSLLAVEQYLLDHKGNIEAAIGEDVIGGDGEYEISIPAARYSGYESVLAWDSDLLTENIKNGINIFGVVGTLTVAPGGMGISTPALFVLPFIYPPALALTSKIPSISVPGLTVA